jgi:hypothetical protein
MLMCAAPRKYGGSRKGRPNKFSLCALGDLWLLARPCQCLLTSSGAQGWDSRFFSLPMSGFLVETY